MSRGLKSLRFSLFWWVVCRFGSTSSSGNPDAWSTLDLFCNKPVFLYNQVGVNEDSFNISTWQNIPHQLLSQSITGDVEHYIYDAHPQVSIRHFGGPTCRNMLNLPPVSLSWPVFTHSSNSRTSDVGPSRPYKLSVLFTSACFFSDTAFYILPWCTTFVSPDSCCYLHINDSGASSMLNVANNYFWTCAGKLWGVLVPNILLF